MFDSQDTWTFIYFYFLSLFTRRYLSSSSLLFQSLFAFQYEEVFPVDGWKVYDPLAEYKRQVPTTTVWHTEERNPAVAQPLSDRCVWRCCHPHFLSTMLGVIFRWGFIKVLQCRQWMHNVKTHGSAGGVPFLCGGEPGVGTAEPSISFVNHYIDWLTTSMDVWTGSPQWELDYQ